MAFVAGAGLPGLAILTGNFVDAANPKLSDAGLTKRIFPTFGALEGVAFGSCALSAFAWYLLNTASATQSNQMLLEHFRAKLNSSTENDSDGVARLDSAMLDYKWLTGHALYRLWFYGGAAFWGVGLAFVRGWSLALPHLVVLYAALGFFLFTRAPTFNIEAKS